MKKGELLNAMLVLVTNAHAGQYDKAGQPYVLHPLTVMYKLKSDDEELQAIALGHDVVEDTDVTYEDLRNIGATNRVIEGIRSLTKMKGETYEEYQLKVYQNPDAIKVKMADLRHNSDIRRLKNKEITEKDVARIVKYHQFYLELERRVNRVIS